MGIKRVAVLGWPAKHSLSPHLHGFWLKQYGIDGSYEAMEVEPAKLEHTLHMLRDKGYAGVNITLPYKEQALFLMDKVDPTARRIGAINTVVMRDGKMEGSNTDAYGFVENVRSSNWQPSGDKVLVIGAGGAARAVCAGLLDEGAKIMLINRTPAKAEQIAKTLGGDVTVIEWDEYPRAMKKASLLVNATSLGMQGQGALDISLDTLSRDALVTDIVYRPLMTPLLVEAQKRGNTILDGLGMLLYQAQPGFTAWFGVKPEVTPALRNYVQGAACG